MTSPNTRFVAVFDNNSDLMISEESASTPELAIGYEDIDINFDSTPLCLTRDEWASLGPLPQHHQLMDVLEHPVLRLLYAEELYTETAETWLQDLYPEEFPYFELSTETPEDIVFQLRMMAENLQNMSLETLLQDDE